MPKLLHISPGIVTGIWGHAWRKLPNGKLVPLQVGEQAALGDQILTSDNGLVRVALIERPVALGPSSFVETAAPLPNLDDLLARESTVAGITAAGDAGSLTDPSLRVNRIAESVAPLSYDFAAADRVTTAPMAGDAGGSNGGSNGNSNGGGGVPPSPFAGDVTTPEDTPITFPMPQDSGRPSTLNGQPVVPGQPITLPSGTLTVTEDGQVIFDPAPNYHGTTTIPFTSDGAEIPGTLTLIVTPVNDAPVANPDTARATEDTPASGNVLLNDSDVDGDALQVVSFTVNGQTFQAGQTASLGDVGTLRLDPDGQFLFTPAPNYNGPVPPVNYTITDGTLTASSVLQIDAVQPVNDAPVPVGALPDQTAQDGTQVSFPTAQGFRDPDAGDTLTYSATGLPPGLQIDPATGVISGRLPADASQTPDYPIAVSVVDSSGAGVTQTFHLVVTNPPPVAQDDAGSVQAGATLVVAANEGVIVGRQGSGQDQDPDGDPLHISALRTGPETGTGAAGAPGTALQGEFGTLTLQPDGSYVYVANHAAQLPAGQQAVDHFTYTVTDAQGASDTAELRILVSGLNDAPVANDDLPTAQLIEDDAAHQVLTGNIVTGGGGNRADTDPDLDPLLVTGAAPGTTTTPFGTTPLAAPVVLNGRYGTLTLGADGAFEYALDNGRAVTQNLAENQAVTEVFSYGITDGHGGTDTATLTVQIVGRSDTTSGTPIVQPILVTGLAGEYYGYNDAVGAGTRVHADDGEALFGGANLNSVEDLELLINGRSAMVGGSTSIVGSAATAPQAAADATFSASSLHYGFSPTVDNDLGNNPGVASGSAVTSGALYEFLDTDAAQLTARGGAAIGTAVGTESGLGHTTDAAIRLVGQIFMERGNYDFRVTADDGFRLNIGGQTLIEFDGNQSPTTRFFENVEISDQIDGLQELELLYWEQGQNSRLHVEFRRSSDTTWQTLSSDSIGLFAPGTGPDVFDHRVQDVIAGATAGEFALRTGSILNGGVGDDTQIGSEARDVLQGNAGNDHLIGGAGADLLSGGDGNDQLEGGIGADILDGGAGVNRLDGGAGDDFYRLGVGTDTIIELAGGGIDTVELGAGYVANIDLATLAGGQIENAHVLTAEPLDLFGNAAANRLVGGAGDNIIDGRAGNDRLIGGAGNDRLTGGSGNDTFEWQHGDQGAAGTPAIDRITDFNLGGVWTEEGETHAFGYSNIEGTVSTGDRLDLRDLLQGEHSTLVDKGTWAGADIGNLLNYLDIQVENGSTVLRISTTGGFTGSGAATNASSDQVIVLDGVNLWQSAGVAVGDEATLVQRLLQNGTLIVD